MYICCNNIVKKHDNEEEEAGTVQFKKKVHTLFRVSEHGIGLNKCTHTHFKMMKVRRYGKQ